VTRLRRLRDDESGMSYVFIGMGMMAFLSASMLAIDVGMLMTSRNQAQNAADAGALAGATALLFNDYEDRSPASPAVTHAIAAAQANEVMGEDVSVEVADVEFPVDPSGEANRVRVTVHRTGARGNPVSTLVARFFGMETADIVATATAEASPANAQSCVKPFTIPDRWIEKQTPGWDADDTFDAYSNKGQPLANPDIYIPADQPGYTGYLADRDRGQRLMIRAGTGNNITPSFYFSLAIGGVSGGDEYRWNIENCNTTLMRWGQPLVQEPGNMVGPTVQGAQALLSKDPGAYWDTSSNTVRGSAFSHSPRVFPIPLYDPAFYDAGKRQGRTADLKVANWIGFFLEDIQGNNIYGRITPIAGLRDKNAGPAPENAFPMAIRLVQ
jgi:Flp pilus assembly protein TadG